MLSHPGRKLWQLLNLVACREHASGTLDLAEEMPASAPHRPMLNDLVNRHGRQQLATTTLMTGLPALAALRAVLPPRLRPRHARRIDARWHRRIT
jgi:hypothetical protein